MNAIIILLFSIFSVLFLTGCYLHHKNKEIATKRVPAVGVAKVFSIPKDRVIDVLTGCAEVVESNVGVRTKIAKVKLRSLLEEMFPQAFDSTGYWYIKFSGNTPYLVVTDEDFEDSEPLDNQEIELDDDKWYSVDLSGCTKKPTKFDNVKTRPTVEQILA